MRVFHALKSSCSNDCYPIYDHLCAGMKEEEEEEENKDGLDMSSEEASSTHGGKSAGDHI